MAERVGDIPHGRLGELIRQGVRSIAARQNWKANSVRKLTRRLGSTAKYLIWKTALSA